MKSEILIDKLCEILDIKEKGITYMSVTMESGQDAKVSLEFIPDGKTDILTLKDDEYYFKPKDVSNHQSKPATLSKEAEAVKVEFDNYIPGVGYIRPNGFKYPYNNMICNYTEDQSP